MSIYFTELDTPDEIIFQFVPKELPESAPIGGRTAQLNKVKYNGGVQTNQKSGVFEDEIEWSGLFFGTTLVNSERKNAKDRLEQLKALVGRVLRVGFPVPGEDGKLGQGDVGVYMVEYVKPQVKNHLNIEYTIRIVPHQRQIKVKPIETVTVKPTINVDTVKKATANIQKGNKKPFDKANEAQKKNEKVVAAVKPRKPGMVGKHEAQREVMKATE